jgi:hypothetical protein
MTQHLTTEQLAKRWGWVKGQPGGITPGTLKTWRRKGTGPRYIKPGKAVLYPLDAVVEYEREHSFNSTADEAAKK